MGLDFYLTSIDGRRKHRFRIDEVDRRIDSPVKITGHILYPDGFRIDNSIVDEFHTNSNGIERVIFNDPATIVMWSDGTKTVVKCQPGDTYNEELSLAMCICKKYFGNKGNFNEVFKKFIPEDKPRVLSVKSVTYADMVEKLTQYCNTTICPACPLKTRFRCMPFKMWSAEKVREAYIKVFCKKED